MPPGLFSHVFDVPHTSQVVLHLLTHEPLEQVSHPVHVPQDPPQPLSPQVFPVQLGVQTFWQLHDPDEVHVPVYPPVVSHAYVLVQSVAVVVHFPPVQLVPAGQSATHPPPAI
jgi:hypothetical protein